ncbi:MAG: molybdopterin-synthase adenylyltransferase MoeB [Thioalkalispiraceae bacterium]|jgi:adenylyltransferase/sulfurtransferase
MNDEQLLRYSRQIMLPQVDAMGQQKLLDSSVLIVGMGGLGSPIAMYLAAAGVGHLIIADFDQVDLSNLQRQILHSTEDIGKDKVDSAYEALHKLNPEVVVTRFKQQLTTDNLNDLVPQVDLVIDGCDNFATRFAVNQACVQHHKPLVSGAAIRFEGQISVFPNDGQGFPCYQCLYKDEGEEEQTCSENGVLAPVVGMIGSMQAIEAIKVLLNIGEPLQGKLMVIDCQTMDIRTLKLKRDPACKTCS